MKIYEVSAILDNDIEDNNNSYFGNRTDALKCAYAQVSMDSGSATVERLEILTPEEVGGTRKWALMLLNGKGFVKERETIAEYTSEKTNTRYVDEYTLEHDYFVRRVK